MFKYSILLLIIDLKIMITSFKFILEFIFLKLLLIKGSKEETLAEK